MFYTSHVKIQESNYFIVGLKYNSYEIVQPQANVVSNVTCGDKQVNLKFLLGQPMELDLCFVPNVLNVTFQETIGSRIYLLIVFNLLYNKKNSDNE